MIRRYGPCRCGWATWGGGREALAASAEATGIYRELAARWSDVYHHELEQRSQVAPGLRTAKTSATHLCGNLRRDNGPLSRVPVAALLAALPDAIMYSHRYAWGGPGRLRRASLHLSSKELAPR